MNNSLISFNYNSNVIRTQLDDAGNPLFCAKDICDVLGYTNSRKALADHVLGDDVTKRYIIDSLGRKQNAAFVNESGLYSLILGSKLEGAKDFKHWVTSEVLPSLRKTGEYKMSQEEKKTIEEEAFAEYKRVDLEKVGSALKNLLKETVPTSSKRLELANNFMIKCLNLDLLDIAQYKPIADNTVIDSIPRYTPTELGKPYGLSAQKINKLLEQAGLQYKEGTGWIPTEEGKLQGGVLLSLDGHLAAGSNISQLKWPITVINLIINNSEH